MPANRRPVRVRAMPPMPRCPEPANGFLIIGHTVLLHVFPFPLLFFILLHVDKCHVARMGIGCTRNLSQPEKRRPTGTGAYGPIGSHLRNLKQEK